MGRLTTNISIELKEKGGETALYENLKLKKEV